MAAAFITHALELQRPGSSAGPVVLQIRERDREACCGFGSDDADDCGFGSDDTGLSVWPSSLVLASWMSEVGLQLTGLRVCELGAGCGLAGLAAATIGGAAAVVLSDTHAPTLANLRHNVALNEEAYHGDCQVDVRQLDWGDVASASTWLEPASVDVLLGADLVYDEGASAKLSEIVVHALRPGGRYVHVQQLHGRTGADELPAALISRGLVCTHEVDPSQICRPKAPRAASGSGLHSMWPVFNAVSRQSFRIQVYSHDFEQPPPLPARAPPASEAPPPEQPGCQPLTPSPPQQHQQHQQHR